MNNFLKLFALLAAFFAARVLCAFCFKGIEAWTLSLLSAVLYAVIFFIFRERDKKGDDFKMTKKRVIFVFLFLSSVLAVSAFTSIVFKPEPRKIHVMTATVAVLATPVGEELFFRATLFKAMQKALNFPIALIFSSLFFALSHSGAAAIITAFAAGVVLCVIFKATDSLPLVIFCHALNNLLAAFVVIPQKIMPSVMIISFILLLIILLYIRKVFSKNE